MILTEHDLDRAAMDVVGCPIELATPEMLQRAATVAQYTLDVVLNALEASNALEFSDGVPVLPYLSDHMVESVLTRAEAIG